MIKFTKHALKRMTERGVTADEILASINRATLALVSLSMKPIKVVSKIHGLALVMAVAEDGEGFDIMTVYRVFVPEKKHSGRRHAHCH